MSKSLIKYLLLVTIVLMTTSLVGMSYLKNKGAPNYEGSRRLEGLSAEVKVSFDKEGVPHIEAKSELDAFQALGFVMAQDRLFQMDLLRRLAKGRLSEIFGAKALEADKLFRTLRLYQQFQEKKQSPQVEKVMDAFMKGVNAYVATGNKPFEYTLLSSDVEPFSREDCFGVLGYIAYSFAMGLKTDPLMESLAAKFGPEKVNELRREPLENVGERVVGAFDIPAGTWFQGHHYVDQTIGLVTGSNAWALNQSRSQQGPLLASDPHVSFGIPGLWYEAHIKWQKGLVRDDFEFYGHFVPLLPFPAMAHTQDHAWAVTISYIDDMDFFWEEIQDGSYKDGNNLIPLKSYPQKIRVKGEKEHAFEVKMTKSGPVVDHLLGKFELNYPAMPEGKKSSVSLKWGHHEADNRPAESFYKALVATDVKSFEEALSYGRSPGINVVYAHKNNHIARYLFGTYWQRSPGDSGDRFRKRPPRDSGYQNLAFDQRPHLVNPSQGIVVSANQKPENTPQLKAGYFQPMDRYRTIHEILRGKEKWTIDEMKVVQTAPTNIFFGPYREEILANLSQIEGQSEAVTLLKDWSLESPHTSGAALLFYTFFNEFQRELLQGMRDNEFLLYCDTNYLWHYASRELLGGQQREVINKSFKKAVDLLTKNYGPVQNWQLGKEQNLTFPHPLSRASDFLASIINVGPVALDGGYNQINNMRPVGCRDGMKIKAGPSTRRLISLSDTRESFGILPMGNSGHYASPFFKNQLDRFLKRGYRAQLLRPLKKQELHSTLNFTAK